MFNDLQHHDRVHSAAVELYGVKPTTVTGINMVGRFERVLRKWFPEEAEQVAIHVIDNPTDREAMILESNKRANKIIGQQADEAKSLQNQLDLLTDASDYTERRIKALEHRLGKLMQANVLMASKLGDQDRSYIELKGKYDRLLERDDYYHKP